MTETIRTDFEETATKTIKKDEKKIDKVIFLYILDEFGHFLKNLD